MGQPERSEAPVEFQDAFARIEQALDNGGTGLRELGYWRILRQVKTNRTLSNHWAEVVGRIDQKAFEARHSLRIPVWVGNGVLLVGTAVGVGAIVVATSTDDPTVSGLALIASGGILSVSLHDLAHWAWGRMVGMRFRCYFLDGPFRIQPGIKTDYASYLRTPPRSRAGMHAAGALASKLAPFVAAGFWWATSAPWWALSGLLALGAVQVVTDIVWSTKKGDWKKVRREAQLARAWAARPR